MDEQIAQLREGANHFESRRLRAVQRLQHHGQPTWCFALLGIEVEDDPSIAQGEIAIRKVEEPPGEIELARALADSRQFSRIGSYSHGIKYELAVAKSLGETNHVLQVAWWFVSLMRIKTLVTILVPVAIDCPWSVVAGVNDKSVEAVILEDVPKARQFSPNNLVTRADITWVLERMPVFAKLLELPRFRMAVDALTTHHHEASIRMTAASLWAGIEAIFSIETELRFRLSTYVAALLEPPGLARLECYRMTRKLYDTRSKAVHGGVINEAALNQHIIAVRILLSRILGACIEANEVPESSRLEALLFGATSADGSA